MEDLSVLEISYKEAQRYLLKRHYARRNAPHSFVFGLFRQNELVGIATFGVPAAIHSLSELCGKDKKEEVKKCLLEFNRLFIENGLGKNSESFFVGQCFKLLPKPKVLVSYADIEQGHIGYIYQATNWIYTGISANDPIIFLNEKQLHRASLVTSKKRGAGITSNKQLREIYGNNIRFEKQLGKHRYVYFLGNKSWCREMKKSLLYKILPYPKGESRNYDTGKDFKKTGLIYKI
jgi:hypothetical protein